MAQVFINHSMNSQADHVFFAASIMSAIRLCTRLKVFDHHIPQTLHMFLVVLILNSPFKSPLIRVRKTFSLCLSIASPPWEFVEEKCFILVDEFVGGAICSGCTIANSLQLLVIRVTSADL